VHEKLKQEKTQIEKDVQLVKSRCSSLLLNGSDLSHLTYAEWRVITKYDEIVFARITPEQKLLIVKEFQHDDYVVGVTGDGVNDAPALKSADIGIAMGSGSEVAMEASQLVLLDNNFSSMLIAIENGRLVFDNLRKVILYLLPAGSIGI
jgi:sodium/potassium-transporting ATPase subunit alpha